MPDTYSLAREGIITTSFLKKTKRAVKKQPDKTTTKSPSLQLLFFWFKGAQVSSVLEKSWFDCSVPSICHFISYLLFHTISFLSAISLTLQNLTLLKLHSTESSRSSWLRATLCSAGSFRRCWDLPILDAHYFFVLLFLCLVSFLHSVSPTSALSQWWLPSMKLSLDLYMTF